MTNPDFEHNAISRFWCTAYRQARSIWRTVGGWVRENYLGLISATCFVLLLPWLWLVYQLGLEILGLLSGSNDELPPEGRRNVAYAIGVTITALAASLAAPLILIRIYVNERQARASEAQTRTAEQGHITDRITKAIEHLGSESIAVRLGGIYALERILVDSPRDRNSILETLNAFLLYETASFPLEEREDDPEPPRIDI